MKKERKEDNVPAKLTERNMEGSEGRLKGRCTELACWDAKKTFATDSNSRIS